MGIMSSGYRVISSGPVLVDAFTATLAETSVGTSPLNLNTFTVGSGSNRALVAWIIGSAFATQALTWNGVSMTLMGSGSMSSGAGQIYVYGLLNPASGNNTLQGTWSASTRAAIGCASFTGVNQGSLGAAFPNIANLNDQSSTTAGITVPSATNHVALGVYCANIPSDWGTPSNTVMFHDINFPATNPAGNYEPNPTGSTAFTYTLLGGATAWCSVGVDIANI